MQTLIILSTAAIRHDNSYQYWSGKKIVDYPAWSSFLTIEMPIVRHLICGSVVVDLLFIVTPIAGVCNCSMFCLTLLYVPSSFAIILIGKREPVALLSLSSWCLVIGMWLFHAVPWDCLQFVIVVTPDHTNLLFFTVCQSTHLGVSGPKRVKVLLLKRYLVYLKTV